MARPLLICLDVRHITSTFSRVVAKPIPVESARQLIPYGCSRPVSGYMLLAIIRPEAQVDAMLPLFHVDDRNVSVFQPHTEQRLGGTRMYMLTQLSCGQNQSVDDAPHRPYLLSLSVVWHAVNSFRIKIIQTTSHSSLNKPQPLKSVCTSDRAVRTSSLTHPMFCFE